jgi:hypothetical protein
MLDDPWSLGSVFHLPSVVQRASQTSFVVAIPVKDEEERLPACLEALARQRDRLGQPIPPKLIRVALFANNCTDRGASVAQRLGKSLSLDVRVIEAQLPPEAAHAGNARRAAMDMAETWLMEVGEEDGVILTTDADSKVTPNWITENLLAIETGADAVLGRIALDEEGELLPKALHERGALEDAYEGLLTELSWLLDPLEHNPWPHHATISGATLCVSLKAYRSVGGCPRVPLGEDKALIKALTRRDAKIRYCPSVRVVTSGRIKGRAPGGVADTLEIRSREPDAFCDAALEPFHTAFARAAWRGRLRRLHRAGLFSRNLFWAARLRLTQDDLEQIIKEPAFGAAWSEVEHRSPLFAGQLLKPAQLPGQISIASRWLARLHQGIGTEQTCLPHLAAGKCQTAPSASADPSYRAKRSAGPS